MDPGILEQDGKAYAEDIQEGSLLVKEWFSMVVLTVPSKEQLN